MPQTVYFHGTLKHMVPSIAELGLLPREDLEELGLIVRYPSVTKQGSVYLVPSLSGTERWHSWGQALMYDLDDTPVSLKVVLTEEQAAKVFPDRNFDNEYSRQTHYFEYPGHILPSQIFVIQDKKEIPIRELLAVAV